MSKTKCKQCQEPISKHDKFCGACGASCQGAHGLQFWLNRVFMFLLFLAVVLVFVQNFQLRREVRRLASTQEAIATMLQSQSKDAASPIPQHQGADMLFAALRNPCVTSDEPLMSGTCAQAEERKKEVQAMLNDGKSIKDIFRHYIAKEGTASLTNQAQAIFKQRNPDYQSETPRG